jgi:uncharacterized membrane protein YeaQ/YmgE (transglycosylase-associated protein family)
MGILAWIVLGAISGWVAGAIMKTNTGIVGDMLVGIVGAVLGGLIMSFFGESGVTGINLYSILVSILGAVVLLAIVRAIRGGSNTTITR